ncbi:hypothetical protein PHOSAC3_120786 [Mesotoga infera]|nr:hypothetical protein PHOSAC3_120786 [Mesotoga infera]
MQTEGGIPKRGRSFESNVSSGIELGWKKWDRLQTHETLSIINAHENHLEITCTIVYLREAADYRSFFERLHDLRRSPLPKLFPHRRGRHLDWQSPWHLHLLRKDL